MTSDEIRIQKILDDEDLFRLEDARQAYDMGGWEDPTPMTFKSPEDRQGEQER